MVGKDVALALGYSDTKSALADHVDAEDKQIIQRRQITTLDIPNRGLTIINESGLYSLHPVQSILACGLRRRPKLFLHFSEF